MLIHLSEVFTQDGKEKSYQVETELSEISQGGDLHRFLSKSPIDIKLTNLGDKKLLLDASGDFTLEVACARCLEPVSYSMNMEITREVDLNKSEEDRVEDLDEQPYIVGYNLDVDQLVYNELLLSLPMKVLCSDSCKGICNRCGTNLNVSVCDCDTRPTGLGMSMVQEIFSKFKEV